jgi:hypothetical protein
VNEVIPAMYTRQPIPNPNKSQDERAKDFYQEIFKPEPCLQVYNTAMNLGVWAVQKKFYINLK